MNTDKTYFLLAGDIGGTNTRLNLYAPSSPKSLFSREYRNSEYITNRLQKIETLIIEPFLSSCPDVDLKSSVIITCLAVAGPVKNNAVVMTNFGGHFTSAKTSDKETLELIIDGLEIENSQVSFLKCIERCILVNDFVGQGYGLLDLDFEKDVTELIPGSKDRIEPGGVKVCIGAGTGLGECFLTCGSDGEYQCYASEGGHVDYTPRSELEVKLVEFIKEKTNELYRISAERVVSGKGLANVYEFLSNEFPQKKDADVHSLFEKAGDMQGRVVGENANKIKDPPELCVQAMEIMMAAYGAEAGNCAVTFIPKGGLFISGGLTPKNIKFIAGQESPFMKAYKDKGRLGNLVQSIPLFAVKVEDLGLRGARFVAASEYKKLA